MQWDVNHSGWHCSLFSPAAEQQQASEMCPATAKPDKGVPSGHSWDGKAQPVTKAVTDLCNSYHEKLKPEMEMQKRELTCQEVTGLHWICLQDNL